MMTNTMSGSHCHRAPRRTVAGFATAAVLAMTALLTAMTACGATNTDFDSSVAPLPDAHGNRQPISQANLNHLWPLTVDHGTLTCRVDEAGDAEALFVTADDTSYALNTAAQDAGFPHIDPLRNGTALGAMRSLALKLCR
jgi:hypothetical protein